MCSVSLSWRQHALWPLWFPGLWRWGRHERWSVVCKLRGQNPLVWARRSQGDRVHRGHHAGTRLLDWVRQMYMQTHQHTPLHLFLNSICRPLLSPCRNDFVTSYLLAFSNDSREWTTIHDGYADWVSSPTFIPPRWGLCVMSPLFFSDSLSSGPVVLWKQW